MALVDEKLRVQKLETWFDSMDMFRQIAPGGIINKEIVGEAAKTEEIKPQGDAATPPTSNDDSTATEDPAPTPNTSDASAGGIPSSTPSSELAASSNPYKPSTTTEPPHSLPSHAATSPYSTAVTGSMEPAEPKQDVEETTTGQAAGEAVAASASSEEAKKAWQEMARVRGAECPFMNGE